MRSKVHMIAQLQWGVEETKETNVEQFNDIVYAYKALFLLNSILNDLKKLPIQKQWWHIIHDIKKKFVTMPLSDEGLIDSLAQLPKETITECYNTCFVVEGGRREFKPEKMLEFFEATAETLRERVYEWDDQLAERCRTYEAGLSWRQWLEYKAQNIGTYLQRETLLGFVVNGVGWVGEKAQNLTPQQLPGIINIPRFAVASTELLRSITPASLPAILPHLKKHMPKIVSASAVTLITWYCYVFGLFSYAMAMALVYGSRQFSQNIKDEKVDLEELKVTSDKLLPERVEKWVSLEETMLYGLNLMASLCFAFLLLDPSILLYSAASIGISFGVKNTSSFVIKAIGKRVGFSPKDEQYFTYMLTRFAMFLGGLAVYSYRREEWIRYMVKKDLRADPTIDNFNVKEFESFSRARLEILFL